MTGQFHIRHYTGPGGRSLRHHGHGQRGSSFGGRAPVPDDWNTVAAVTDTVTGRIRRFRGQPVVGLQQWGIGAQRRCERPGRPVESVAIVAAADGNG